MSMWCCCAMMEMVNFKLVIKVKDDEDEEENYIPAKCCMKFLKQGQMSVLFNVASCSKLFPLQNRNEPIKTSDSLSHDLRPLDHAVHTRITGTCPCNMSPTVFAALSNLQQTETNKCNWLSLLELYTQTSIECLSVLFFLTGFACSVPEDRLWPQWADNQTGVQAYPGLFHVAVIGRGVWQTHVKPRDTKRSQTELQRVPETVRARGDCWRGTSLAVF